MTDFTPGPWTAGHFPDNGRLVSDGANIHLIAAAPDMFAALASLVSIDDIQGVAGWHLNGDVAEWGEFEDVGIAIDALAKARGE